MTRWSGRRGRAAGARGWGCRSGSLWRSWGCCWRRRPTCAVSAAARRRGRGRRRSTLVGHDGAVGRCCSARDGSMLGSVGANGTIAVWDLDSGLGYPLPPAGPGQGRCAAFSPDGRLLAAGRAGGPVALHDLQAHEAHRALRSRPPPPPAPECLAFAPDGRTLAVGQQDGRIALWDVATRRERPSSRRPCPVMPRSSFAGVFARRGNPGLLRRRPRGAAVGRGDRPAAAGDRWPARYVRGAGVHAR